MILHMILRRIKRRHGALWVDVRWLEPFGDATWAISTHLQVSGPRHLTGPKWSKDTEIARSRSFIGALWKAWKVQP